MLRELYGRAEIMDYKGAFDTFGDTVQWVGVYDFGYDNRDWIYQHFISLPAPLV